MQPNPASKSITPIPLIIMTMRRLRVALGPEYDFTGEAFWDWLQTAYIAALQNLGTPERPLNLRCGCRMSAERMERRFHCGLHSLPHDSHAFKFHLLFSLSGRNGTPFIEHFHDCLARNRFVVSSFASKCELKAVESAQILELGAKPQHFRRLRLGLR